MHVRHRNLGGGDEVVIAIGELEEVFLELRQLPRAEERVGVDDERRDDFDVAMPLMHVEHEVDERAIQLRAGAGEDRESRAGDLRGALEVEDAQPFADVPMGFRREGKRRLLAP